MPDFWMDVDATLAEVPVNVFPLIDDTDFKAREEAVAYNAAGLDLLWNFVTPAGATSQTAVTPTTGGGDYDWTNQGNGIYTIGIPASGGASINNDTAGFGWFSGYATGVLPWRGPVIGFRASGLNDALIESAYSATRGLTGTALPAATAGGNGGVPTVNASNYVAGMQGTINTLDALDTAQDTQHGTTQSAVATAQADLDTLTGADGATLATTQGNYAPAKAGDEMDLVDAPNATAVTAIQNGLSTHSAADAADAVWDEDATGHQSAGTFGEALGDPAASGNSIRDLVTTVDTVVDAIKVVTDALGSAAAAKLADSMTGVISTAINDASASTTAFVTDLTETTDDHYNSRIIVFISGNLAGQATDITDYDGATKTVTVTALTEAPANNDQFVII